MEANEEACVASVEKSLSMVTSLNPHIGYEKASALAKEAFKSGETIRELCTKQNILPAEQLNAALDPFGKIPEFKYCAVAVEVLQGTGSEVA